MVRAQQPWSAHAARAGGACHPEAAPLAPNLPSHAVVEWSQTLRLNETTRVRGLVHVMSVHNTLRKLQRARHCSQS